MKVIRHRPIRRRAFRSPSIVEEQPATSSKKRALLIGIRYSQVYTDNVKEKKSTADGKKMERARGVVLGDQQRESDEGTEDSGNSDLSDSDSDSDSVSDSLQLNNEDSFSTATTVEDGCEERSRGLRDGVLLGPHRDVLGMKQVLIEHYGYEEQHIVVMMDDEKLPEELKPTRDNILARMDELVEDAQPGDNFFFHYSGHSTQQESEDKEDEEDGKDEYLVAADDRLIKDNELRDHLVKPLPPKSKLTAVFDSCHSASLLDLPHNRCNRVYVPWISKGQRRSMTQWNRNVRKDAADIVNTRPASPRRQTIRQWTQTSIDRVLHSPSPRESMPGSKMSSLFAKLKRSSLSLRTDFENLCDSLTPWKQCMSPEQIFQCDGFCRDSRHTWFSHGPLVLSLSASKDSQRAWERANGDSMTQVLIRLLNTNPNPTLEDMLLSLSHDLHRFYLDLHRHAKDYKKRWRMKKSKKTRPHDVEMDNFQDPQISSQHPLDLKEKWSP